MAYKSGNYSAFYVSEPFSESSLGAAATKDFVYYNMIRAWKGNDSTFPFNDSHNKNYNVRDGSNWELTLKPRLRERLRESKNIVYFLSSKTKNSIALREEILYGVGRLGLPVIVVYPEYKLKTDIVDSNGNIRVGIQSLWNKVPVFHDHMNDVPTLHIPYTKELIKKGLKDTDFMINTKTKNNRYFYRV